MGGKPHLCGSSKFSAERYLFFSEEKSPSSLIDTLWVELCPLQKMLKS